MISLPRSFVVIFVTLLYCNKFRFAFAISNRQLILILGTIESPPFPYLESHASRANKVMRVWPLNKRKRFDLVRKFAFSLKMDQKNTAIFPTIQTVNSKPNTILYHGDCPDGFGSAFCAWRVFEKK